MTDTLTGKRILIVEDEYFIASDLRNDLAKAGAVVVGPVGDLDKGLALAVGEALDATLLDVNVEGAHSYAIADALAARGVPYAFLTGYDAWALPSEHRGTPRIAKPFLWEQVAACIERLLEEKQ